MITHLIGRDAAFPTSPPPVNIEGRLLNVRLTLVTLPTPLAMEGCMAFVPLAPTFLGLLYTKRDQWLAVFEMPALTRNAPPTHR
jgi:hypothetical protein